MTKEFSVSSAELTLLTRDLDANLFYEYYQKGGLGVTQLSIPGRLRIEIELDRLFEHVTNLKSFKDKTTPDNIEAICVFGSALYKHFETEETITQERRKWVLFGPKQVETQTFTRYKKIRDFDLLVILKEGLTGDKIIIPKRSKTTIDTGYGYFEQVESDGASGVLTFTPVVNLYGYIEGYAKSGGDLDLHISYRSVEQFAAGLGQGDELSESVVRYGVPLIGQERFDAIVGSTNFERAPLHSAQPFEDSQGKLQIKIR